ncbi:hypothetical protein TNCT_211871 [Trichonephila clavata]|uniref:BTB domain-containing protein n=1 Tax=Trichonephila clavata TaxID=2740835 RepID=A0A8X6HU14_TRICU|nr:hypothetical protein TNCT_211871 [Trichonephila clavata]
MFACCLPKVAHAPLCILNRETSESGEAPFSSVRSFRRGRVTRVYIDVKLRATTQTHELETILSVRSPVFLSMLVTDMEEMAQECVDVLDLEDDTLRRTLMCMYYNTLGGTAVAQCCETVRRCQQASNRRPKEQVSFLFEE